MLFVSCTAKRGWGQMKVQLINFAGLSWLGALGSFGKAEYE